MAAMPKLRLETNDDANLTDAQSASDNLRVIREMMERSTRHSTFSGLSGVIAGSVSILGCAAQLGWVQYLGQESRAAAFIGLWTAVLAIALGADFLLTKRQAPLVGKHIRSRLGKQMILGSAPGLGTAVLATLALLKIDHVELIYPLWMLCYGTAVCSVGLFSQREVRRLGWAFLTAGAFTTLLQFAAPTAAISSNIGIGMTALSFGVFHIVYGVLMARREGTQIGS